MHLFGKEIKIAPHLSRSQKRHREAQIGRIRLVIKGVPKDAELVAFREIFEPYGDIDSYYIQKIEGEPTDVGYVTFLKPQQLHYCF